MRRTEPLEPEVEAALEAIDATLAGEPVDPEHAELAELSLILRSDRPAVRESFAATMDARVRDRFGTDRGGSAARRGWRRVWPSGGAGGWLAPAGVVVGLIAVIVVLVSVTGGGGSSSSGTVPLSAVGAGSSSSGAGAGAASSSASASAPPKAASKSNGSPAPLAGAIEPRAGAGQRVGPPAGAGERSWRCRRGRTGSTGISQRVFDVVGVGERVCRELVGDRDRPSRLERDVPAERPRPNLQGHAHPAVAAAGAPPSSRARTRSRDITGAGRRRRTSAGRGAGVAPLAAAPAGVGVHDRADRRAQGPDRPGVDRTIDRDQAALTSLHRQVRYGRIELTIQGSAPRPRPRTTTEVAAGSRWGAPATTAVHVLVVAAGVLLIALAVAIPVGLVATLVSWLWLRARRKAREAALDRA